jgi:hypothetical protein
MVSLKSIISSATGKSRRIGRGSGQQKKENEEIVRISRLHAGMLLKGSRESSPMILAPAC